MKIIISAFLLLLAWAPAAFSQTAPAFCTGSDIDMTPASETCLTTCKAVASRSASYLSSGDSGFCIGQATKSIFNIYELKLGRSSSGTDALCTIWSGAMQVSMKDNAPGAEATGGVIDLTKCANGTYDTLHIIVSRFTEFAGNTVFPNATGTGSSPAMVRTTTAFGNSTDADEYDTLSDWLETSTSHSDDMKEYVRPTASWNTVYKKLASAPSATDLSSASDFPMFYDELKGARINDTGAVSGWYCESAALCYRKDPNDERQIEMRLTSTVDALVGMPLAITEDNGCTVDVTPDFYAGNRGGTEELGVKFLWRNDSGTLKYLGAYPGENGLYITVGTPRCQ
ncbi:MAG TPA: hypothetical protein DD668_02015 [Alphaproteobacteria bacterium]|nr:hypothetical protein [Alphaproteobacteria bacterium]HCA91033.1 hypothetical protein [Alphaproteobacteria bacterium]